MSHDGEMVGSLRSIAEFIWYDLPDLIKTDSMLARIQKCIGHRCFDVVRRILHQVRSMSRAPSVV